MIQGSQEDEGTVCVHMEAIMPDTRHGSKRDKTEHSDQKRQIHQ